MDLPIFDQTFKADPYSLYDKIRKPGNSVVRVRLPSGVEAWLVTSYVAARQLLKDPRLSKDSSIAQTIQHDSLLPDTEKTSHSIFQHLLMMDPPDHTRLRSLLVREFSSHKIKKLRPRIKEIVAKLLDKIAPQGKADLIKTFALPLPLKVICELVGVSASDEPLIQRWSANLLKADLEDPDQIPVIAKEVYDYLLMLAKNKRHEQDDSLYCKLVKAHDNGELSIQELTAMGFVLLSAGHETTTNLIGNGVLALLRNRSEWSMLCARGDLACSAVEEILRFDSPLEVATQRFATAEILIEEVCIRPGDMVFIGLGAANRDPYRFENACCLDINRTQAANHIAFGSGIHYCIGAELARLEGEVAFTELVRRFPDLELDVDINDLSWTPGLITRGLQRLPVRFEPQPRQTA